MYTQWCKVVGMTTSSTCESVLAAMRLDDEDDAIDAVFAHMLPFDDHTDPEWSATVLDSIDVTRVPAVSVLLAPLAATYVYREFVSRSYAGYLSRVRDELDRRGRDVEALLRGF